MFLSSRIMLINKMCTYMYMHSATYCRLTVSALKAYESIKNEIKHLRYFVTLHVQNQFVETSFQYSLNI